MRGAGNGGGVILASYYFPFPPSRSVHHSLRSSPLAFRCRVLVNSSLISHSADSTALVSLVVLALPPSGGISATLLSPPLLSSLACCKEIHTYFLPIQCEL